MLLQELDACIYVDVCGPVSFSNVRSQGTQGQRKSPPQHSQEKILHVMMVPSLQIVASQWIWRDACCNTMQVDKHGHGWHTFFRSSHVYFTSSAVSLFMPSLPASISGHSCNAKGQAHALKRICSKAAMIYIKPHTCAKPSTFDRCLVCAADSCSTIASEVRNWLFCRLPDGKVVQSK